MKFGTGQGPGWAKPGTTDFTDPRPELRPLPKDWLRYRGLYAHGDRVVFAYTVGGVDVLETPGVEAAGEQQIFTRTFHVAPSKQPMTMLVAETDGGDGKVAGPTR